LEEPKDDSRALEKVAKERAKQKYLLRLYVAGVSSKSERAIRSVKEVCEQHLKGCYNLEIVDIYQHPEELKEAQIVAVPTLIRRLPLPLRRMIGDMSIKEKLIVGLDLKAIDDSDTT
jgi:circadian clock protein KaiB